MTAMATASTRQLMKTLAGERHRGTYSNGCAYCGTRCYGYTCRAHRDLPQLEAQLFRESNEVAAPLSPGSATTSQQTGA